MSGQVVVPLKPNRVCTINVQAYGDDSDVMLAAVSAVLRLSNDGDAKLVELTVRASEGGEISAEAANGIDFQMLARAFGGMFAVEAGSPGLTKAPVAQGRPLKKDVTVVASERPYRKMPADVKSVFEQTHSVGELARHFKVPRYTAQAWVDRLRRSGDLAQDLK
ncbi:MAG TPA: hypothetical protein VGX23_33035 [Actinocrinis sp.]|nr:hypothetical protein [Actinocrinis sp.]